MSTLLRPLTPVHSNPLPGPRIGKVGMSLGYPHCNVAELAVYFAEHGTTLGCEVVEFEDVLELDAACRADGPQLPFAERIAAQADWFRAQDTPDGRFLAAELDELARQARELYADDPETFVDRRDALSRF